MEKYKISNTKKSFDEICFPKNYELQMPQKYIPKYIGPDTNNKGILLFWQIGSGKTCGAIRIAEEWKGKRNIIVVLPASLKGNFRNELRTKCGGYLTDKERSDLKKLSPLDDKYVSIIKHSNDRIDKYYKIYSYNKFLAQNNSISLRNSILIIDEIQNLVSLTGKNYEILKNMIDSAPKDLRIALLSATPMFDKPSELALIMNLLRLPKPLPIGLDFEKKYISYDKKTDESTIKNISDLKSHLYGFVSHYRGAPSYTFPNKIIKYVKCEMSEFQYRSYLTVLKSEPGNNTIRAFRAGNITKLPNNFFIGTRIISNIAFPNKDTGEEGYKSLKNDHLTEDLEIYSTKFAKIIKKLNSIEGTGFMYSNFKEYGGLKSFIKALEANGYKDFAKYGQGKKRFAIWSGDEKADYRETIREIFNKTENSTGKFIKLICGSPAIKEGVSLYNVKQVHILEPMWNIARLEQVIGRAVRYCSHKNLPKNEREVKIYIYIATSQNEKLTIDEYIAKMAIKKHSLVEQFEHVLKEVAVDCNLFINANQQKNERKIQCDNLL